MLRVAPLGPLLPVLAVLYGVASFVHFAHNAEFLVEYPNLPAWLTRVQVYAVWLAITALGALGYGLLCAGQRTAGLLILVAYAGVGFDGLLHYARAPMAEHTGTMNATIWSEVVAAALLLATVIKLLLGPRGGGADEAAEL